MTDREEVQRLPDDAPDLRALAQDAYKRNLNLFGIALDSVANQTESLSITVMQQTEQIDELKAESERLRPVLTKQLEPLIATRLRPIIEKQLRPQIRAELLKADGLHPTAKGYALWSKLVRPHLRLPEKR